MWTSEVATHFTKSIGRYRRQSFDQYAEPIVARMELGRAFSRVVADLGHPDVDVARNDTH
jgi:hypothetical protein